MAEFSYQGVGKDGGKVTGTLSGESEGEIRVALRGQGIRPTRINKVGALNRDLGSIFGSAGAVMSMNEVVVFTRQLQVLISSGVPIVQSLEILTEQASEASTRAVLATLKEKVSGGAFFWESLAAYPDVFPKLYCSLIRAGESSGSIDTMLKRLSRYLEDAERLRKLLKGAMTYPIIVIAIGGLVVAAMMVFVIPKFEELLSSNGQELPGITKMVIGASHFFVDHILAILLSVVSLVFLFNQFKKSPEGRAFLDRVSYRLPIFGEIAQKGGTARFSRTMATLLSSGVNLMDAIDICQSTIDNSVLEEAVSKIRADVEAGRTMTQTVIRLKMFPRMAEQMIAVGESTGNLDKMLERVAEFYEEEVEAKIQNMTKLIEPFVMVFLGGMVGVLMIAMYLPIFKMGGE